MPYCMEDGDVTLQSGFEFDEIWQELLQYEIEGNYNLKNNLNLFHKNNNLIKQKAKLGRKLE